MVLLDTWVGDRPLARRFPDHFEVPTILEPWCVYMESFGARVCVWPDFQGKLSWLEYCVLNDVYVYRQCKWWDLDGTTQLYEIALNKNSYIRLQMFDYVSLPISWR